MLQEKKRLEQKKSGSAPKNKGINPSKIRLESDIKGLKSLPKNISITYPKPEDKSNFVVRIEPNSGFYLGGVFDFDIKVDDNYPISPPKVKCIPKIFHPNIDLEGNVCLNILREEWTPALDIYRVIMGLVVLFSEPNPMDPLNKEAANMMSKDRPAFINAVNRTMAGGYLGNEYFDHVRKY